MTQRWETRTPTQEEMAQVRARLREVAEHYSEWTDEQGNCDAFGILLFAWYEGCAWHDPHCRGVVGRSAPYALGQALVDHHGFRWVMVRDRHQDGDGPKNWRPGADHDLLDRPVDLTRLEKRDKAKEPGRKTLMRYTGIVRFVLQEPAYHIPGLP